MFSIGDFSRITTLSIKALHLYHEKGILIPAEIDTYTGYRYYDHANIEKARVIIYLKNMEFSLKQINEILSNYNDDSEILDFLESQKQKIADKLNQYKNIVSSINQIINQEKEITMSLDKSKFEVEEKEIKSILIAGVRYKGKYSDCGIAFGKIGKSFGKYICGKPLDLYYDEEYMEDGADIESCMPIRKGNGIKEISVRELKGGKCVSLIHKGPYEEIGRSYEQIMSYINDKGIKIKVPNRLLYLKGPGMIFKGNTKNYITEIQMLIDG